MSLDTSKKIGLVACTGVVAGNMMGSGIALLPSALATIGSISVFSWAICLVGAMGLAFVFARLATKNPQEGGPIAYAGEISPVFGFQTGVLYYHANWIGNLAIAITGVSYLSVFFPFSTAQSHCRGHHRRRLDLHLRQPAWRQLGEPALYPGSGADPVAGSGYRRDGLGSF